MKKGTLPKTIRCIWHLQSWGAVFPFQKKTVKERSPEEGDVQQKSWPQSHPAWAALNPRRDERASSCEWGAAAAKNFQPLTQFEGAQSARGGAAARTVPQTPQAAVHGNIHHLPHGLRGLQTNYLQSCSLGSLWRHSWLASSSEKCLKQYPQWSSQIFLEVIQDNTSNTWLLWRWSCHRAVSSW